MGKIDLLNEGLEDLREIQAGRAVLAARREADPEYRVKRAAKLLAKKVELAYWPALAFGPKIDPAAYVAAETVLTKEVGSKYGDLVAVTEGGGRSRGGWDSYGYRGLSSYGAARCWYAAGCKDSPKYRAQVARLARISAQSRSEVYASDFAKKSESLMCYLNVAKGGAWLRKHFESDISYSRKALGALGRLPWYCRWAAVCDVAATEGRARVRVRDMNWEAVKVAQKGPRAALRFMPRSVAQRYLWGQVIGFAAATIPTVAQLPDFDQIRWGTLQWLMGDKPMSDVAELVPAARLVQLFGADRHAITRFVGDGSVHDAGQLRLPARGLAQGWAGLVSRAPTAVRYLPFALEIQDGLGGSAPKSLAEAENNCPKWAAVAWAAEAGLTATEEEEYARLFAERQRSWHAVPAPNGTEGVAQGHYRLVQLASDDPRQATAGAADELLSAPPRRRCCVRQGGLA